MMTDPDPGVCSFPSKAAFLRRGGSDPGAAPLASSGEVPRGIDTVGCLPSSGE